MRILQICLRVPFPLTEGSCIETFNYIRQLALKGHQVTVIAFEKDQKDAGDPCPLLQYCNLNVIPFRATNSLPNLFRGAIERSPINFVKYRSPQMLAKSLELLQSDSFDVVIVDHSLLGWYLFQIKKRMQIPMVVRFHDLHTLIWERWAQTQSNPIRRFLGQRQASFVRNFERRLALASDLCLTIGARDTELLRDIAPGADIRFLPVGVDVDRYAAIEQSSQPENILFLASQYRWHPNWDAVKWLHDEIMPRVWEQIPAAKLFITGKETPVEMQRWAATGRVELTGFVPDDRTVISKAGLIVIPMRLGAGIKLKMLTAFASGRAVVSTSTGAEGVPGIADGKHLLLRDSPREFADAIIEVIRNGALRNKLQMNARALIGQNWDWNAIGSMWDDALRSIVGKAPLHASVKLQRRRSSTCAE